MSKLLKVLKTDSTTGLPWKSFGGKLGGGLERTGETWKLGPNHHQKSLQKQYGVCACDSAPSLMHLAKFKSFQVGFSTSATGGCWLVGFRSGQSAPDMKGICSSSSLLMAKCKTKYIQGKQQALDAVWWTQLCSKLASRSSWLWGRVVTIIKVTRSRSRGFQKHFLKAMWKENHEQTWVAKLILT